MNPFVSPNRRNDSNTFFFSVRAATGSGKKLHSYSKATGSKC